MTSVFTRLARDTTRLSLGVVPILSLPILSMLLMRSHNFAFDFHTWYWPAGHRILDGVSPYSLGTYQAFKYPAISGLLFVPFALLPHSVADWVFTLCAVGAVPATLYLLNVRDWRVFGIVLLWQPVVYGWETANMTLLLVFGVAVAWRFRSKAWLVGIVIALLVSIKLFLLPLLFWLIATRRYVAVAWSVVATVVVNAAAWLVLGLDELSQYEHMMRGFAAGAAHRGYSAVSLLLEQGVGGTVAYGVALLLGVAAIIAALRLGRKSFDLVALTMCLGASLIATPLMESHYLALLLVPLALVQPRLTWSWSLPLLLWLAPVDHPAAWQRVLTLAVGAAVFGISVHRQSRGRTESATLTTPIAEVRVRLAS